MRKIILWVFVVSFARAAGAQPVDCAALSRATLGANVVITSSAIVPPAASLPAYCDVRGTITAEGRFALRLPAEWNGRFVMVGNGGLAGTIMFAAMDAPLGRGFAVASTDTGHDAAKEPLATFAETRANNPNAREKVVDFAYASIHKLAEIAKQLQRLHYGRLPTHSYFVGCSTGGRHGLIEAQRFSADFDGYVIGAPVLDLSATLMRHIWNAQAQDRNSSIPIAKLDVLARAVYERCDARDGLADRLISDPQRCAFNPAVDLKMCQEDQDDVACFTRRQIAALSDIYAGPGRLAGGRVVPGQTPGAEIAGAGGPGTGASGPKSGWDGMIVGTERTGLAFAESYMRFIALVPPPSSAWTYRAFDFATDPSRLGSFEQLFNATNPDLTQLASRGGKIIHYHGWADPMASPAMSIAYRNAVVERMGATSRDFYRLFLIPGLFHCGGGVGCGNVDWLTAIVNWVEQGIAPEKLTGAQVDGGRVIRTRPVCEYPQVPRYRGDGDVSAAASFSCVLPD